MNQTVLNSYADEEVYSYYDEDQHQVLEKARALAMNQIIKAMPETTIGTVVDLGCGTGNMFQELLRQKSCQKLYGIDLSAEMLAIAQQKITGLTTICDSAIHVKLHFSEPVADLLLMHFLFSYLDCDALIKEASDVIKSNGILSICTTTVGNAYAQMQQATTPTMARWAKRLFGMDFDKIKQHYDGLMPNDEKHLTDVVKKNGFDILSCETTLIKVHFRSWREGWNFMYKAGWLLDILKQYKINKFKGFCLFQLWRVMSFLAGKKELAYALEVAVLTAKKTQ